MPAPRNRSSWPGRGRRRRGAGGAGGGGGRRGREPVEAEPRGREPTRWRPGADPVAGPGVPVGGSACPDDGRIVRTSLPVRGQGPPHSPEPHAGGGGASGGGDRVTGGSQD